MSNACGRSLSGFLTAAPPVVLALAACAGGPSASPDAAAAVRARLDAIESSFNAGDFESFFAMHAEDAALYGQGFPDTAGRNEIRALYEQVLEQVDLKVDFHTEELVVAGDLAYERGTYRRDVLDKATGAVIESSEPRHIHILRRGDDGVWRSWRLMTNEETTDAAAE